MINQAKCRICRRLGEKLFLKGDKCSSPKCPLVRRPYPPGQKKKKRNPKVSEYGRELIAKQMLRHWYNLGERQFKRYVKEVLNSPNKGEDTRVLLIRKLENRLDNVIFRMGIAVSRNQARKLVSHRHFLVNGKPVNIPSYQVKKGDKISLNPSSLKKVPFQGLEKKLKGKQFPLWIKFDHKKKEGEIVGEASFEEVAPPSKITSIFEFYSR